VVALVASALLEAEFVSERVEAAGTRIPSHWRARHVALFGAGEAHWDSRERRLERDEAVGCNCLIHPAGHDGRVTRVVGVGVVGRDNVVHVHRRGARPVLGRLRGSSEKGVMRVHALRLQRRGLRRGRGCRDGRKVLGGRRRRFGERMLHRRGGIERGSAGLVSRAAETPTVQLMWSRRRGVRGRRHRLSTAFLPHRRFAVLVRGLVRLVHMSREQVAAMRTLSTIWDRNSPSRKTERAFLALIRAVTGVSPQMPSDMLRTGEGSRAQLRVSLVRVD